MNAQSRTSWDAENFRVTFFVTSEWAQRPLFIDVTGAPPSESIARPQLQLLQETGSVFGSNLTVSQQPGRIDMILGSSMQTAQLFQGAPTQPFPQIGPLHETIANFDKLASLFGKIPAGIFRVAYAISLIRQLDNITMAMEALKNYVHSLDFNPQSDTDLVYQINRPGALADGTKINRLRRWEVIESRVLSVMAQIGGVGPPPLAVYAARAYIDISTSADNTVSLPANQIPLVIDQLRSFALEIAEEGDVK